MGAPTATLALLLDAVSSVQNFLHVFIYVYLLLIFVYVLTSWVRLPYSMHHLQRFLYDVVEPYLRLFRRVLPSLGPLDLSPMVAVVVLIAIDRLVVDNLLGRL
jgi:YggT family protein